MLVAGSLNEARQPGTRADFPVVGCDEYIDRKLLSYVTPKRKSGSLFIDLSMTEKRAKRTPDHCAPTFPGDRSVQEECEADPDRTRASLVLKRLSL